MLSSTNTTPSSEAVVKITFRYFMAIIHRRRTASMPATAISLPEMLI